MSRAERYKHLVGKTIRIESMPNEPRERDYIGREGEVLFVDDMGDLHGTWGGLALIPNVDSWSVLD